MGGVAERQASGKGWGVPHNTEETGDGLAGTRGGTTGEDIPDLAGSGRKLRAGGGSGRKTSGVWSTTVGGRGMASGTCERRER